MSVKVRGAFCDLGRLAVVLHDCRFAGGIAASGQSSGFGGNLFGRDALRVALDLIGMPGYQSFVSEILTLLPQWQGVKEDSSTNEFPGAIPHQVFRQRVGGLELPIAQVEMARHWTEKWGVEMIDDPIGGESFVVYNSSDGPLLYLIALARYIEEYDNSVLTRRFLHRPTGQMRTVAEAATECVSHINRSLGSRELDDKFLYAVPNTNPLQTSPSGVMRDGFDAYLRPDGSAIDYSIVAYVENQALAYEALILAAKVIFPGGDRARFWIQQAEDLRREALAAFWMPNEAFFASAIDRRGQVCTHSSAVFELLNGPFFEGLQDGRDYVTQLVRALYSPNFMTPAGVRMVSLEFAAAEGEYYSYQGSGAVWGVTNGIIAKGLRKWGMPELAYDLGTLRFVASLNRANRAAELLYVHRESGEPAYQPVFVGTDTLADRKIIAASGVGQDDQAWTASAAIHEVVMGKWGSSVGWAGALERELLDFARGVPTAGIHLLSGRLAFDLQRGEALKQQLAARTGLKA